jgi:flagellar assembly factor FliW
MATTQPASEAGETLFIASRLFGPLTVPRNDVIVMPDGMLGFAGERRFILLPAAPEGIFWLQSVEESGLVFLLVDPFIHFAGYEVDLPDVPEPGPGEEVAVLTIVTLPRERGEGCTANLQGPLVIHFPTRVARQVVLSDSRYHTKHPLDLREKLGGS